MSGNATGSGGHTVSDVNAEKLPHGEQAEASNVSTTGGGFSGPAKRTAGHHNKDWKNFMDPHVDANSSLPAVRAEAHAQAKAESEHERQAAIQQARAEERGDAAAQHQAELERVTAANSAEAARARAEGRAEGEAEVEARRRAEEQSRVAGPGGVRDAVKSIAKTAHGAGDTIRGRVNAGVDESFGDTQSAAAHRETARAGEHKIGANQR